MPSGKKANAQQSLDELKLKYLTVDRNYEALKTLTRRGKGECTPQSITSDFN